MKHSLKLRSESNMTPDFLPVERLAFCTSNVKDAIGDNMDVIAGMAASGQFKIIPASASKDDVDNAVGFPFNWDASDEALAQQQKEMAEVVASGKLAYHYEVIAHRYFEETGGVKREGAQTARRGRYASVRAGIV